MKVPLTFAVVSFMAIASAGAASHEFQFARPDAQQVDLTAEFNGWKGQPMHKGADGTWTLAVSVSPGTYGYKFLVDGKDWVLDPSNPNRKTVEGVENSSVAIEESAPSPSGPTSVNASPIAQPGYAFHLFADTGWSDEFRGSAVGKAPDRSGAFA